MPLDYEYPPQQKIKVKVLLRDSRLKKILHRKMDVWTGEPVGDWVLFRGIRIALTRKDPKNFEGIVPDEEEDREEVTP